MEFSVSKIYTIGTNRRAEEDFIEILLAYGIGAVIDVRRFPRSKLPAYNREYFEGLLGGDGIGYFFLGVELGGYRRGGYIEYTQTDEFRSGIDKLEGIAREMMSVIVCAERFPWKCHRRWIARELQRRGWHIIHIIDKGKVWEPG